MTHFLHCGTADPPPERRELRAGPLTLAYERGDLRYVRRGGLEIVRRLYAAVRDRNWGTVPAALTNESIDAGSDSFRISYEAEHRQREIHFVWKGSITGDARGTVVFSMQGEARSTFLRNRIGLCVLHPIELAGHSCRVEHPQEPVETTAFPVAIAPHAPMKEIRALAHDDVEIRFEGEIFEMEDQRNWVDASYKTFGTPLRLPFPVEIKAGTRVSQSVTIRLLREADAPRPTPQGLGFSIGGPVGPLPQIGVCLNQPLEPNELARLRALNLSHLRVEPDLLEYARPLGWPMEIPVAEGADLDRLSGIEASWLVYGSVESARKKLRGRIGAGTNAYFMQLNRNRPKAAGFDFLCYSINPQVHAFDNASLVETLFAHRSTVESARGFARGRPIAVTPVTLKPRFNPAATGPDPEAAPGELPERVDPRQMSLFGAGWTLGSLKYLAESGVQSATYYEATGWLGVMESERGSPLPEKFRSWPGCVFPMYHVFADVGEFAGATVLKSASSDPLTFEILALDRGGRRRILIANLGPTSISLACPPGRIKRLDETNAERAMRSPEAFRGEAGVEHGGGELALPPFGLVRVDTFCL